MEYKGVTLGTEDDHELSVWIEVEGNIEANYIKKLQTIEIDGCKVGNFEVYAEGYGQYRSDKFTFDEEGISFLKKVIDLILALSIRGSNTGVSIYSNEFTHIEGNIDEISFDEFIESIKLRRL